MLVFFLMLAEPSLWSVIASLPTWLKFLAILVAGGGLAKLVEKSAKGFVAWMQADSKRDAQEHKQEMDLREEMRRDRQSWREDMKQQRDYFEGRLRREYERAEERHQEMLSKLGTCNTRLSKIEGWTQDLVIALKHERFQVQRLFNLADDYRADLGKPPLSPGARKEYLSPHFDEVLQDSPWGDMRGSFRPGEKNAPDRPPIAPRGSSDSTSTKKTTK